MGSPNKHNRIYLKADKMTEELCKAIEDGTVGPKADPKERMKMYRDKFDSTRMRLVRSGLGAQRPKAPTSSSTSLRVFSTLPRSRSTLRAASSGRLRRVLSARRTCAAFASTLRM